MQEMNGSAVLHVRFEGRSFDIPLAELDLGLASADQFIHSSVATYMNVPMEKLHDYVIDRHQTGNMTLRPEAVFG